MSPVFHTAMLISLLLLRHNYKNVLCVFVLVGVGFFFFEGRCINNNNNNKKTKENWKGAIWNVQSFILFSSFCKIHSIFFFLVFVFIFHSSDFSLLVSLLLSKRQQHYVSYFDTFMPETKVLWSSVRQSNNAILCIYFLFRSMKSIVNDAEWWCMCETVRFKRHTLWLWRIFYFSCLHTRSMAI